MKTSNFQTFNPPPEYVSRNPLVSDMNDPSPQHPGLRFDCEGSMYWNGRHLKQTDMPDVLAVFQDLVALHLMAWWEKSHLPLIRGELPQSKVLWEMAGLMPLRKLLDSFRSNLESAGFFADRMEAVPEAPKPLPMPKVRFRFPAETLAGELERRTAPKRDMKAWVTFEARKREIEEYQRAATTFPGLCEKARRYPAWQRERQKLEKAYELLDSWDRKLKEAAELPGWEFLPPGPGLCYSPKWLKSFLGGSDPELTYDFERIRGIQVLDPVAIRRGSVGSVSGYLAFVFAADNVALESPRVGNALYFFRADWQHLCRLPKGKLRRMMAEGDPRIERFCHTSDRSLTEWLRDHLRYG